MTKLQSDSHIPRGRVKSAYGFFDQISVHDLTSVQGRTPPYTCPPSRCLHITRTGPQIFTTSP